MATRRETFQRRSQLLHSLRERHASGELRVGEPAPSVRQLAGEFGLSNTVVAGVLGELIEEGLFHTRERAGTFVGPPPSALTGDDPHTFLLVREAQAAPGQDAIARTIESSFETRVAQLGGAALSLDFRSAQERWENGLMPPLVGVGDISARPHREAFWNEPGQRERLARVCYGSDEFAALHSELGYDTVAFDDVRGGDEATHHLLSQGHRRVGFFGVHEAGEPPRGDEWSAKREAGWRAAMERVGLPTSGLAFHPVAGPDAQSALVEAAQRFGATLSGANAPTALVAANDALARLVLDVLAGENVPGELWPSVVGFDADREGRQELVSSLQLPWDGFGRLCADTLWERHQGRLPPEPQRRLLPMQLVPRLTCRRNWSRFNSQTLPVVA